MAINNTGTQSGQNWNPIILGDTEANSVLATLGQLQQQMPFLIGLSRDERARLAKIGDRTRPFVDGAMATALANPGLVPRSVDLDHLQARTSTLEHLGEIKRTLAQLLEQVVDTETQLGSDLYAVARSVYSVMKSPVTVPGLNDQKDRLSLRFAKKANRPDESLTIPAKAA